MTVVPENFVPGLDGVVAFTTEIAEPDKDGGALRYRGVDIEDLVSQRVTFGDVWALLVDGSFGGGLPPAEPFRCRFTPAMCASTSRPAWRCWRPSGDMRRCSTSTTPPPANSWPGHR